MFAQKKAYEAQPDPTSGRCEIGHSPPDGATTGKMDLISADGKLVRSVPVKLE